MSALAACGPRQIEEAGQGERQVGGGPSTAAIEDGPSECRDHRPAQRPTLQRNLSHEHRSVFAVPCSRPASRRSSGSPPRTSAVSAPRAATRPCKTRSACAGCTGFAWSSRARTGDESVFRSMVWWAVKHTRQGRMPQGYGSRKGEVRPRLRPSSDAGRQRPADRPGLFRRDFGTRPRRGGVPHRYARVPGHPGRAESGIALDLAAGLGTGEVARKWGVTPGAISQFRTRFQKWWNTFHGEAA